MDINKIFETLDQIYAGKESYKAEGYLKECLEEAKTERDAGAQMIICNELGGYYRALGRCEEAIPLFQLAVDCIHALNMTGSENHATTLINYATTYAVWGKPEKSMELFQEAYDMLAALGIGTDFRMATLHNNMSILCQDMGDFDNALDHLNKALGILSQLYDAEMEVAITYTNIAQVHLAAGNMEGAKEAALESIRVFRENDGYGDVHYSAALEIFGQICLAEGDKAEALNYFEEARDLIARDYGMDNPTYEAICQSIERCDGC